MGGFNDLETKTSRLVIILGNSLRRLDPELTNQSWRTLSPAMFLFQALLSRNRRSPNGIFSYNHYDS